MKTQIKIQDREQRPERKAWKRNYYLLNREEKIKQSRKWFLLNSDKHKNYTKKWELKNRKQRNKYKRILNKKRRKNDFNYLMRNRLRTLLYYALKKYGNGKIMESRKYGVNYLAIIEHLKPFPEDISKYHIDHIMPLSSFDLTNSDEIKQAFAPENHQWLLATENLSKGARILQNPSVIMAHNTIEKEVMN